MRQRLSYGPEGISDQARSCKQPILQCYRMSSSFKYECLLTGFEKGRSAFEAPEISSQNAPGPSERKVDASNQAEPAGVSGLAPSGPYVQLYDERGHPINPTSRALGRRIRQAQNDVLAAIGVVERTTLRLGDEHALSDDNAILENLQDEVLIGNICSFESSLTNWLSTLWIDSIRKQLMVRI